ncbi:MAG: hypothetical protein ABL929_04585 [Ferruginibacter sp.]|nr:hypothetical protein [Ferruginibacter sp.]
MKKITALITLLIITMNLVAQTETNNYRLIIKFGSIGTGVPENKPLLTYIANFKKKNKIKKIAYNNIGPMGREGEYYMAFYLKELKKKQAEIFVKEISEIASKIKEKGTIEVVENEKIDITTLSARQTITKIIL